MQACAGSSPRASPASGTCARAARSRRRTIRSTQPARVVRETSVAMNYLDEAVVDAGGIALRYPGNFYGAANDGLIKPVRKRQFPVVGDGGGVASFIHLDDAAAAFVLALEHDGPAIYNVVDDEPAPTREWLPVLAEALGAKPPRHFPVWLARLFAGDVAVMLGTEVRGASNAKAKRELELDAAVPELAAGLLRGLRPGTCAPRDYAA